MTNQYVWIGLAVGLFFAGLGVSYAVFISTHNHYTMMGNPTMSDEYGQPFKTIAIKDVTASSQLFSDAQVSRDANTVTFSSQNVNIIALSMSADDAKNMTKSSPSSYAKGDVFVIGNMIDPTLVIKSGTNLGITSINLDEDMAHNFVIMTTIPPYSYMPMHGMMYSSIIAMMPILPNDDTKDGYAYEQSYQVTLSQPGTYWYVCTYPGHAEQGMYGKIIVR
jgi:rusticyanin